MKIRPMIWIERTLMLVGVVCLGAWASENVVARLREAEASRHLDRILARSEDATPLRSAHPTRPAARDAERDRSVIGRMEIPRLELSAVIAEGTGSRTLGYAVGHVRGTAYPGEDGNVCLAGHRDTHFRKLSAVRPGDRVRIRTPDGEFAYRVESIAVMGPRRTDVMRPTRRPGLTLITCYPFDAIGPAPRRFVVRAVEVADAGEPDLPGDRSLRYTAALR